MYIYMLETWVLSDFFVGICKVHDIWKLNYIILLYLFQYATLTKIQRKPLFVFKKCILYQMHWVFQKLWNYTVPFSSLLNFLCWHQLNGSLSFTMFKLTVLTWAIPFDQFQIMGFWVRFCFCSFFLKRNCHRFV